MLSESYENKAAAPAEEVKADEPAEEPEVEDVAPAVKLDEERLACGHVEDVSMARSRHRMENGLPVDELVCRACADYDYSGDSQPKA